MYPPDMRMHDSHQLRLSYLKHKMNEYPRCNYGEYSGRKVIYVLYDPTDKSINSRNRKRYFTDTPKGKLYSKLYSELLKLESEYKRLMNEWELLYKDRPELITFPIKRSSPILLSTGFFRSAGENRNDYPNEDPIVYGEKKLRSKNELIAIQVLESMGYECKTEVVIWGKRNFYPDVLFLANEVDRAIGVELDGGMDMPGYRAKALKRQSDYLEAGFKEYKDMIFYRLWDGSEFDVAEFKKMVEIAVEMNAAEIINSRNRESKPAFSGNVTKIPESLPERQEFRESGFYL